MSVYNEANVSCEPSVTGGGAPFNYLDGNSNAQESDVSAEAGNAESKVTKSARNAESEVAKSAGDGPPSCGQTIASAPAMTEMYRSLERSAERGSQLPVGVPNQSQGHGNKRAIQSQPELGCRFSANERQFASSADGLPTSATDETVMDGRDLDTVSDVNDSVSFEHHQRGGSDFEVSMGQSLGQAPSRQVRSNAGANARLSSNSGPALNGATLNSNQGATLNSNQGATLTSNSSFHKLSRRSEKRLKKNQGREDEEEIALADIVSDIYRRSAHSGADRTLMTLKMSQSSSEVIQWLHDHGDCNRRSSEYRKTKAPKKRRQILVDANDNNNNNSSGGSGAATRPGQERISSNGAMEALRRQPLNLAEKEAFRSSILNLASESKSPFVGNFDRRRHRDFRRQRLKDRRAREPRGSGGFFVNLIKEFGQPITSYFDFLRWLILVNVFLSIIIIVFLVIPQFFRADTNAAVNVHNGLKADGQTDRPVEQIQTKETLTISESGNSSKSGEDLNVIVAALFTGSDFMTRYPTPIFYSFFGEAEDGEKGGGGRGPKARDSGFNVSVEEMAKPGEVLGEGKMEETLKLGKSKTVIRFASWLEIPYDFPLAFVIALHAAIYLFVTCVIVKMMPFAMESISAKLERVDRGFACMIFATFDHGTTDETTLIMNQITMTDELLMKLDAADAASSPRPRIRVRRCCDVVVRVVVSLILLSCVLSLCWALFFFLRDPNFFVGLLRSRVDGDAEMVTDHSKTLRCAAAFFDDFSAPTILFLGLKLVKGFSAMLACVENWKPAKKDKVNQARVLAASIALTFFYFNCLWLNSAAWKRETIPSAFTAGCNARSACWPVLIGQHFYRLWVLDFVWCIFVVLAIQFPRKLLFSHLCLHRSCGRFSIQPFSISRRILDLIYSELLCLVGLYFAPGIVFLTAIKFIFIFYLMRLTVHCNCIPKGRLYQSIDSVAYSYTLLGFVSVLAILPFQVALMQGLPISSCGPFKGIQSFSHIFHLRELRFVPPEIVEPITAFLDSPLAPFLLFLVVVFLVVGVVVAVIFVVQKQKIYQLQHENDAERRDRAFLLRQYDVANMTPVSAATAVSSTASLKHGH